MHRDMPLTMHITPIVPLQEKWMNAKDLLSNTLNIVAVLNSKLDILSFEYATLKQISNDLGSMALADCESMR